VNGGGIGGLGTAVALAQAGRRVHVVEQAPEFGEIGAGLQLGPNAIRSLDRLGVWSALEPLAVMPPSCLFMDAVTGERLTRIEYGAPFVEHYGYPYVVAHRHDVHQVLLNTARAHPAITLETNRRVEEVTEGRDAATVRFADGAALSAPIVVGADGIRSRTRLLHDESEPLFTGQVAFRGTVPMADLALDLDTTDMILWIGPNRHLIQYPVRGGNLYNLVAVIESHWHAQGRDDWGSRAELDEVFADSCEPVLRALALFDNHTPWPIHDRDPLPTWSTEHTVLIGDAAHAMRQYLAQGACQALEDALTLAQELTAHHEDPPAAFAAYEARRLELATKCQLVARPWGDLWHTLDQTMQVLRNKYFRLRADDDYSEFDWLYLDNVGAGLPHPITAGEDAAG
jgi:2-polyprenyl-6-methoxyphenol hydroxylase-like FAD-dependent oxidoreductase